MPQPTAELQEAIQALHAAIAGEPDPEDKAELSQCLNKMLRVQAKNMTQDGGRQAPAGAMPDEAAMLPPEGMPPGGMPPGAEAIFGAGAMDPRQALLEQLGAGGGY